MSASQIGSAPRREEKEVDILVVGAGFGGLACLHQFREQGFRTLVVEAGDDVGGTWYWNRYPGARCDVESLEYSFCLSDVVQKEWTWTERYATQPEILSYLQFVALRLDLRKDIEFNTRVATARYDSRTCLWTATTSDGLALRSKFVVMATGSLSTPKLPEIEGLADFEGDILQTARWPREGYSFALKNVGVIGTGSSGIQVIPHIAAQAEHLTVFQRTPSFSIPARNGPLQPEDVDKWRSGFSVLRERARRTSTGVEYPEPLGGALEIDEEAREAEFQHRWQRGGAGFMFGFSDLLTNVASNALAADFVRARIDEIVDDPATARMLKPTDYPIGAKRICVDTDYYATFNRDNVKLIDLKADPIQAIEAKGVRLESGIVPFDTLVIATGFDAMTGALLAIDIQTDEGFSLRESWSGGPATYLGLQIAGLPNLFVITGPGSPSVLSNMVLSIEHDAEWIRDCLVWMRNNRFASIEPSLDAQRDWMEHVEDVAGYSLHQEAASWYRGSNVPGKPRVFMPYIGGVDVYQQKCREVAENGYAGFILQPDAAKAASQKLATH